LLLPPPPPRSPLGSPDRPARLVEEGDPAPLHDDTIKAIAAKHAVEPAQVLIAWQVQRGVVVIPKSVTPARIASNLASTAVTLDAADLAAIAGLDKGMRLIKGYPWLREGETWQALWDLDFLA
jgi:diketogulonate reductase-like aldo/keto reductase